MTWAILCTLFFAVLPYCSPMHEMKTTAAILWLALVALFAIRDSDDQDDG